MTKRQSWAIFCACGLDVRNVLLDVDEASNVISRLKSGDVKVYKDTVEFLQSRGATGKPKPMTQEWDELYQRANLAGMEAGNNHHPRPMVVCQHRDVFNDNSPIEKEWFVSEGVCGFAEVIIRPGTCSFAKWLVKNGHARKHYYGGVSIWVHQFGQSMERKEKYACAFAQVIKEAGIRAYAQSRMD